MKNRKFLIDKEIDLKNGDFLKTKIYADNLVKIITATETNKVFTIGLYGSWGSGKSSIIETAKNDFKKTDKIKFITYDAWQYSNDSFRRMFLRSLSKQLNYSESNFMKRFYENESMDVDNKFKISYSRSIFILLGLLILLIILSFIDFKIDHKITVFSIVTLLGTLTAIFTGIFHQLKISITKPYLFAPEQFEECFKEIATKALKTNSLIDKFIYLNSSDKTIKDLNKLVIVIDNIDRCHRDIAYQLLTDIKTFLGSQDFSIVFIIPVDDKALLKHFFSKNENSNSNHKEKEEFLRKIFNVTLRIKPYNETDMFSFTKSINDKYALNLKNETINIIGKEYSNNPRRVIQLINNLISELNNYKDKFSLENETIICCVLIIREEYPDFYDEVIKNQSVLLNDLSSLENVNSLSNNQILTEEVFRFMRIAEAEFKNTKISVLNKILLNSDNLFSDVPIEVVEMINTFNSEKIIEYLKNNRELDASIFTYVCYKIDEASKNGLKLDLAQYFQLVGTLSTNFEIPHQFLSKIFEKLKERFETVIFYSIEPQIILQFIAYEDSKLNKYSIKKSLIERTRVNINTTEEISKQKWLTILSLIIENYTDQFTCEKLKDDYTNNYDKLIDFENFNENQFTHLITEQFMRDRISDIRALEISSEEYKKIKILFENIPDKLFLTNIFFEKIGITIDGIRTNENFDLIIVLNDFLKLIKDKNIKCGNNLLGIINKIFSNGVFEEEQTSNPLIIDNLKNDRDKLIILKDLIFFTYKATNNVLAINNYMYQLSKYIPNEVQQLIIELKDLDADISGLFEIVNDNIDYDNLDNLNLLKYYLAGYEFSLINGERIELIIIRFLKDLNTSSNTESICELLEIINDSSDYYSEIIGQSFFKLDMKILGYITLKLKNIAIKYFDIIPSVNYITKPFFEFIFEYGDERATRIYIDMLGEKLQNFSRVNEILDLCHSYFITGEKEKLKYKKIEIIIDSFKQKHSQKLKMASQKSNLIKLNELLLMK